MRAFSAQRTCIRMGPAISLGIATAGSIFVTGFQMKRQTFDLRPTVISIPTEIKSFQHGASGVAGSNSDNIAFI